MRDQRSLIKDLISGISKENWKSELDTAASKYHLAVLWVAVIFDPVFAITDYVNIPQHWQQLLSIRIIVSVLTLIMILFRRKHEIPSYVMVVVGFFMISLQNAYIYSVIDNSNLLGQNLNYMALIIGASMFLVWPFIYSVFVLVISAAAMAYFVSINPAITIDQFFVQGGLLLMASAIFMMVQIRTRYDLTVREIKARLALKASNEEILAQAEEIKGINDNLESLVHERTYELQKKNKALEEYAFINAHKLRAPVASILGLMSLLNKQTVSDETRQITEHLLRSTEKLDEIVTTITRALEKGDNPNL
jgi:signal transduction histidine kinase